MIEAAPDQGRHGRDEEGSILVVRMDHDDDVGPFLQGGLVAGFLVAAVAEIPLVKVDPCFWEGQSDGHCLVLTFIVDDDDQINDSLRQHLSMGFSQGFRRVVGGHDNNNFLILIHGPVRQV